MLTYIFYNQPEPTTFRGHLCFTTLYFNVKSEILTLRRPTHTGRAMFYVVQQAQLHR